MTLPPYFAASFSLATETPSTVVLGRNEAHCKHNLLVSSSVFNNQPQLTHM